MPAKLIPASDWNAASFSPPRSPQILRRWCRDGRIPVAILVGREWLVPADAEYRAAQHQSDIMRFIHGRVAA